MVPGTFGTKSRENGPYLYSISVEEGDVERVEIGRNLQLFYATACHGGSQISQWQKRLAPAEVITFGRISGGMEHLWWLWYHGPERLKRVR